MRLIDVEQCPCNECNGCFFSHPDCCPSFERWANKTAYDVDKVVDELINAAYPYSLFDIDNCEIGETLLMLSLVEDIVGRGGIE